MAKRYILGIESSCDETSAGIIDADFNLLSNVIHSQTTHSLYGGVVPEIASREHVVKIEAIVDLALEKAGLNINDISLIAATSSPGLIGAVLVGLSFAKGLAFATGIPFVGVNHMDGHVYANFIDHGKIEMPFLSLVVSGGHTFLMRTDSYTKREILGQTLDDAAGEAFDKIGKMLGLNYPAGREISELALKGDPDFVKFPRPLIHRKDYNFSFSGLKTAVLNYLKTKDQVFIKTHLCDIAASVEEAIVDVLSKKTARCLKDIGMSRILLAGGVACNNKLREKTELSINSRNKLYFPSPILCTDNGAMIAAAGEIKYSVSGADTFDLNAEAVFKI